MEYVAMELRSPLYGLDVKKPISQEGIAVLENLNVLHQDNGQETVNRLRSILDEIKQAGVKSVVVDLSRFSRDKFAWLYQLEGFFMAMELKGKYIGVTLKELYPKPIDPKLNDPQYVANMAKKGWVPGEREAVAELIADDLESAVKSFIG